MPKFRKNSTRNIGRRNLPFIGAVLVLGFVVVLLMYLSPRPYNDRGTTAPPVISTE
jgi:hypothetical protein